MRRLAADIERVVDAKNHIGETPVWSEAEQALYWTNVENPPEILRWEPKSKNLRRWPMPERVGGIALKQGGGALIVLASGLFDFDFATGALSKRVSSPLTGNFALHECGCDPTGRFWVGSINRAIGADNRHPGGATFFRLDGKDLVPVFEGFSCANGLGFSPDGRSLYFSDSTTGRADLWDLDPKSGEIKNRRTLFQLEPGEGFCDGATVDSQGGYWVSLVYGGALRRYLPDGTPDLEVKLPFENPTKVVFAGSGLDTMYITSMVEDLGPSSPLNGGLFSFKPGFTGYKEPLLAV